VTVFISDNSWVQSGEHDMTMVTNLVHRSMKEVGKNQLTVAACVHIPLQQDMHMASHPVHQSRTTTTCAQAVAERCMSLIVDARGYVIDAGRESTADMAFGFKPRNLVGACLLLWPQNAGQPCHQVYCSLWL
jgi:hypothetical protein